jgi:hypothetical protein
LDNGDVISLTDGDDGLSPASTIADTIAIAAIDGEFSIYINQKKIAVCNDNTWSNGAIGLVAFARDDMSTDATTEIAYNNARLWD